MIITINLFEAVKFPYNLFVIFTFFMSLLGIIIFVILNILEEKEGISNE